MTKYLVEGISPDEYINQFLVDIPGEYKFQNTPVQIYELSSLLPHLRMPTPLLRPDYNFIIHLTQGEFTQQIGTDVYNIKAPSVLTILNSYTTALREVSKDISGYFILVENKALNKLLSAKDLLNIFDIHPVLNLSPESNTWLSKLHSLLYGELSSGQPDRETVVALSQAVLYKIIALSTINKNISSTQAIALKFKQLAYQSYVTHKDVGFYAKEIRVSNNYLNRCVKSTFGKTVKEVIIEICILQSQLLLQDVTKDISEVASELNFEDPSYWGRLFKKVTGQTPTEYKKMFMHD